MWATLSVSVALSVSDAFVVPFLWLERVEPAQLLVFAGLQFVAMAGVFFGARWLPWPPRRFMRWGIALMVLFLVSIAGLGHAVAPWVDLLGMVAGLGYGSYWLGLYVAALGDTRDRDRDRFNGTVGTAEAAASLIGPLAGAALIRWAGGFVTVFAVSVAGLVPSWLLTRAVGVHAPRAAPREAMGPGWRPLIAGMAARGAYEGILVVVPGLLMFETTGSAVQVGAFASLVAAMALVGNHWAGRAQSPRARPRLAWMGAGLVAAASALLAGLPLPVSLWGFGAAVGLAIPLQKVPLEAWSLDVIGHTHHHHRATASKELALNGSRAVGLLLVAVMLVGARDVLGLTRVLFAVPAPAVLVAVMLARGSTPDSGPKGSVTPT